MALPRRNTDALIGGVATELAKDGIELIDSTYFLQDHLPSPGTITKRKPTEIENGNIEYGLEVAKEIARLDLGQTIVIRAKACVLQSRRWKEPMQPSAVQANSRKVS